MELACKQYHNLGYDEFTCSFHFHFINNIPPRVVGRQLLVNPNYPIHNNPGVEILRHQYLMP